MRRYLQIACVASALVACGGGGDEDDTTAAATQAAGAGDESPADPGAAPEEAEPIEASASADEGAEAEPAEPGEDEGPPCLPVARCRSFANQDCASLDAEGQIEGETFSAGEVREACPGQRGVSEAVQACFQYIELDEGCGRNLPDLREPPWPCGRNEDGTCAVQML